MEKYLDLNNDRFYKILARMDKHKRIHFSRRLKHLKRFYDLLNYGLGMNLSIELKK